MKYWKDILLVVLATASYHFCYGQIMGNRGYSGAGSDHYNYAKSAEQISRPTPSENEILISASALYNVLPQGYVATFGVSQTATSADLADQTINSRIHSFNQEIGQLGIREKDIHIDMLSFIPKYAFTSERKLFSKTFNEIPAGFELHKNISIRYKESSTINKLISIAAKHEIYDLIEVEGFLTNTRTLRDSMQSACIAEINRKVRLYQSQGFRLDTLKKTIAENFNQILPQNSYASYTAFARPGLATEKSNSVVNETEKPVSQYFEPIESGSFDIVVNPAILEPPIQLVYSLTIRYMYPKDSEREGKNWVITPAGTHK